MAKRSPAPFDNYQVVCPNCNKQNLFTINGEHTIHSCPSCKKQFDLFLARVRSKRGRKSGNTREYKIRFFSRAGEGEVSYIDHGGSDLTFHSGDLFYASFKKGDAYPSILTNITLKQYVKISKGGCFIATVTCGYDSWEVESLYKFRNQTLMANKIGQALVTGYYQISPQISEAIREHNFVKQVIRYSLVYPIAKLSSLL